MPNKRIIMASSLTYSAPTRIGIHHYASLFARNGWNVFFLSSQLSPLHIVRKGDRVYAKEKIRLWMKGGEWENGIFSYSYMTVLPILPFWSSEFFLRNTLRFTLPRLSSILERHNFTGSDVMWIENPHLVKLPSKVKHNFLIYRIPDEIKEFKGCSSFILEKHQNALRSANLVITTARRLYEKYNEMNLNGEVLYISNGVDFPHFSRGDLPMPLEYKAVPAPIIVYAGIVAQWFDQDLVIRCAKRLKNVSFVIIGPAIVDTSRMAAVENIYLLGVRKYDELPSYLTNANVGIIPFKINELVESVNPLKLYEYMAAGLPVVCTDWDEMREMASPAMLAGDVDEFCDCVEKCFAVKNKKGLISFARSNAWESRFQKIMREIESHCSCKHS